MALVDLFNGNRPSTTVMTGGTDAPASNTVQTWLVASSLGFPAAVLNASQFRIADPAQPTEIIFVTNVSANTWTVVRGAEGTAPAPHLPGFTVNQVITSGLMSEWGQKQAGNSWTGDQLFSSGKPWIDVCAAPYNADPTGATDCTTGIQDAIDALGSLSGGGILHFGPGQYKISSRLTLCDGLIIIGDGPNCTQINQTSTAAGADGLYGFDLTFLEVRNVVINGPGQHSGSNHGINLAGDRSGPDGINAFYVSMSNVFVTNWGSDCIYIDDAVMCDFVNVTAHHSGGAGFYFYDGGTSCTFISCYAHHCNNGFRMGEMYYTTFVGCGSDNNTNGYKLEGCQGIAMFGCGAEENSGDGVQVNSKTVGVTIDNQYTNLPGGTCIHVTGGCTGVRITSPSVGNAGTATAFIKVDSGCGALVMNMPASSLANNFAAGTTTVIDDANHSRTVNLVGALDMGTHQIHNVSSATVSTDGPNFGQVQAITGSYSPADMGFIAWNFDPRLDATGLVMVSGAVYLNAIFLRSQQTITNLWTIVTGAGSGLTTGENFLGLINSAGTLLDTVAMDSAFGAVGYAGGALHSGPQVLAAGMYWVAALCNASGTKPALMSGLATSALKSIIGNGLLAAPASLRSAVNGSGASLGNITPNNNTAKASMPFWVGVS